MKIDSNPKLNLHIRSNLVELILPGDKISMLQERGDWLITAGVLIVMNMVLFMFLSLHFSR